VRPRQFRTKRGDLRRSWLSLFRLEYGVYIAE
jgi:hypothetical protein